jgi:hypothetical protein
VVSVASEAEVASAVAGIVGSVVVGVVGSWVKARLIGAGSARVRRWAANWWPRLVVKRSEVKLRASPPAPQATVAKELRSSVGDTGRMGSAAVAVPPIGVDDSR